MKAILRCVLFIGCLCPVLTGWLTASAMAAPLAITPAQQQWLEAHRELRVGIVLQAPYAQYDRRAQQLSGVNVQVMTWVAQALKLDLTWRQFETAEQLEQATRAGEVDVAPGQVQTPAGLRVWQYTDPYMRIPQLLVGLREGARAVDLETLGSARRIALTMPGAVADYLRATYPGLDLQGVPRDHQALELVSARQADYAVVDESQLIRLSQEDDLRDLLVVGDIGRPQLLRIASRADWPQLGGLLDQAVRSLPARDLERLHEQWLKPRNLHLGETPGFWQNLSWLALILFGICLLLLIWQRRQVRDLEGQLLGSRETLARQLAAEQALHLTRFSIDQSTIGILWVNWDSHVRYANAAAERMFGYAPGELIEQPLMVLEPTVDMDRWLELWRGARAAEGSARSFETLCQRADGSPLPVELALSFLRHDQVEYLVVYLADVTQRRGALAALRESEARFKGITANVPGLVFRLERRHAEAPLEFAYISEGSEALLGCSPAELSQPDVGLRSQVHPQDRPDYHRTQDLALNRETDWAWQGRMLTRQGVERWVEIRASARRLAGEHMVWDGIVWDLTENKRVELQLAASRSELRELAAHLESVREEEKARIAREVHDELGQMLTAIKLEASMCQLAHAGLDPALDERLASMQRSIAQLFQLIRDVASALRPPILDAGIGSAIEWQARRFEQRTGIPCLVQVPESLEPLSDARAIGLFRILQEALTNVMRHAHADSVEVDLTRHDGRLTLSVADDGRGFAPDVVSGSFGLVGMRERAAMLGGWLSVDSRVGEGTQVVVVLPVDQENAA